MHAFSREEVFLSYSRAVAVFGFLMHVARSGASSSDPSFSFSRCSFCPLLTYSGGVSSVVKSNVSVNSVPLSVSPFRGPRPGHSGRGVRTERVRGSSLAGYRQVIHRGWYPEVPPRVWCRSHSVC